MILAYLYASNDILLKRDILCAQESKRKKKNQQQQQRQIESNGAFSFEKHHIERLFAWREEKKTRKE